MSPTPPNRIFERSLAGQWGIVAGVDEVGRGSLAGPVCVGLVAVQDEMGPVPFGLADSKLLSPKRRESLIQPIRDWCLAGSVGWSSAQEIDRFGIIGALRLAGWRALSAVNSQLALGGLQAVGGVLLDGVHDWFTPPPLELEPEFSVAPIPPVITLKKADFECVAVAAASVLAKVDRDHHMRELNDPGYDWLNNKGYASPTHMEALSRLGPCALHRRSWKLPGVG